MKINVLGGGPSGLYFAYLARKRLGDVEIHVHERNAPDATFGFGVVLAGAGLSHLAAADAPSFERIQRLTKKLASQEIILDGHAITIDGEAYGGAVERLQLLQMLHEICEDVGVKVTYHDEITDPKSLEDADLLIGADGANSTLRDAYKDAFGTYRGKLNNAFAWYGAERVHDRPTLSFRSAGGGAFCAHYYPYTDTMSTFVMECDKPAWDGCGFADKSEEERKAFVEELYREELKGGPLVSNKSNWINFEPIRNENWVHGHRVLIGDAARRAHFSIGSGTRIAMEDSIALVDALAANADISTALASYAQKRKAADLLSAAARESYTWYEQMSDRMRGKGVYAFAFDYLTRTSRVDSARVATEYPNFMKALEAERAGAA